MAGKNNKLNLIFNFTLKTNAQHNGRPSVAAKKQNKHSVLDVELFVPHTNTLYQDKSHNTSFHFLSLLFNYLNSQAECRWPRGDRKE